MDFNIVNTIKCLTLMEFPTNEQISPEQVRDRYRKLCKVYHPDQSNARYRDGERFKTLRDAYEYLNNNIDEVNRQIRNGFSDSTNSNGYRRDRQAAEEKRKREEEAKHKAEEAKRKEEAVKRKAEKAERVKAQLKEMGRIITVLALSIVLVIAAGFVVKRIIIPSNKYNIAVELYQSGEYQKALDSFSALGEYKDCQEQISLCKDAIMNSRYDEAVNLYQSGEYQKALDAFSALGEYRDSRKQVEAICWEPQYLESLRYGDSLFFGLYEQDNNLANGKEPIEWIVLSREESKALVISKYILDCHAYNQVWENVTWETCSIRKWLNNNFINDTFSTEEQFKIQSTTVSADRNPNSDANPGIATTDQIFLLSILEAEKYYTSNRDRRFEATEYALAQGADNANCWWLRSPGSYDSYAALVNFDGSFYYVGYAVYFDLGGVRPAMWIDISR